MARPLCVLLGVLLLLVTAVACSGKSSGDAAGGLPGSTAGSVPVTDVIASGDTSSAPLSGGVTGPPKLRAKLLTLHDLPAGWKIDRSGDDDDDDDSVSCLSGLSSDNLDLPGEVDAEADFVHGDGLPMLEEDIAQVRSASAAKQGLQEFTEMFEQCGSFVFSDSGGTHTGAIRRTSVGDLGGDEQAAFTLTLTFEGVPGSFVFLVARKGNELALMVYGDLGSPDTATTVAFARKAVAKL